MVLHTSIYRLSILWLLTIIIFFTETRIANSQQLYQDTLFLKSENPEHLSKYYNYYLEPAAHHTSITKIDSMFSSGIFKRWYKLGRAFNPGLTVNNVWFRVAVQNTIGHKATFLWTVYNHMDSIYLYKNSGDSFSLQGIISGNKNASLRPYNTRNFALPFILDKGENAVMYLKLIHLGSPIYVVSDITTTEDYVEYEERFLIRSNWYWLIGFFAFAMIFNLVLFFFLRDKVHIWYAVYVLFTSIFLLMEDSLDGLIFPQWIYTILWRIDLMNFLLLSGACGIGIMQSFIKQNKTSILYRLCKTILFADISFVLINAILFPLLKSTANAIALLWVSYLWNILIILSGVVTIVSIVDAIIKKNKLAYYYAFAYTFFLLGASFFFLNNAGISVNNHVKPNALAIGLFWELFLLLFFITVRFQFLVKENSRLAIHDLEMQKESAAQIILAQDEERHRMAKDLHDDLGNTMTRIQIMISHLRKANIDKETTHEMESLVKKAATDIRNISHELMPANLEEDGLEISLRKLCNFLSVNTSTACQFFFNGKEEKIPLSLRLVIYRIFTELSNNIIKHAEATQSVMQCIIYESSITLTVEDNGKGISNLNNLKGIGLKNIHNRVALLKGKLNIDTSKSGTTIIIELVF